MFQLSKSSVGRETLMSVLYNQRATGHFAAVTQREIHYSRLDTVPPFSTFTSLSINQNAMQPLHRAFWVMAPTHCTITITLWVQCMLLPIKKICAAICLRPYSINFWDLGLYDECLVNRTATVWLRQLASTHGIHRSRLPLLKYSKTNEQKKTNKQAVNIVWAPSLFLFRALCLYVYDVGCRRLNLVGLDRWVKTIF